MNNSQTTNNPNMLSFFEEIKDSTITWTDDDDVSISKSYSSSDFDSSDDESLSTVDPGEVHVVDPNIDALQHAHGHYARREPLPNHNVGQDDDDAIPQNPDDLENRPIAQNGGAMIQMRGRLPIENGENEGMQAPQQQQPQHRPPIRAQPEPARMESSQILRNLEIHQRSNELMFRIARCEQLPLIRAEIDWQLLQQQFPTYPGAELGDKLAVFLLQSVLRMDPPLDVIREITRCYPKSCVDMDPFYAACQYSSDEVVQLLMRRTMKARLAEGINWSMLALLGDARIRLGHAMFLLQYNPEAVVDSSHGPFGVSPLDRMLSGAFIHGDAELWVSKVKLALLTADRGSVEDNGSKKFYPFHALVRRIISSDFMGVQFGAYSFVNCLSACVDGEESHLPFHQVDEHGNLPIHVVFGQTCNTNLGIVGERKLVKFLLHANKASASIKNGDGTMPIRLAVENGWPVYDIIVHHCLRDYTEGIVEGISGAASLETSEVTIEKRDLLFHDVLNGPYSNRFGISGARELVRFVLKKFPIVAEAPDVLGRYPIHLAIENVWPCHDLIVAAAPFTLEVKDPLTGMYPFQIAATLKSAKCDTKSGDSSKQLSTLYELIREGPLLLQGFRSEEHGDDAQKLRCRNKMLHESRRKVRAKNKRRGSSSSRRGSKLIDSHAVNQGENGNAPPTKKKCHSIPVVNVS